MDQLDKLVVGIVLGLQSGSLRVAGKLELECKFVEVVDNMDLLDR
jgi:hypothetical protein